MKSKSTVFFFIILLSFVTQHSEAAPRAAVSHPEARGGNVQVPSNFTARSPSMSLARPESRPVQQPTPRGRQNLESLKQKARQFSQGKYHPQINQPLKRSPIQSFQSKFNNEKNLAKNVTSHVKNNHPGYHGWFNSNFFRGHNYHPAYWNSNSNWWQGANWYQINQWLNWNSAYPIYYDDNGYPEQIEPSEPSPVPPPVNSEGWLPLGVFALGADVNQASFSNMFVQLAINPQGEISGTYYNSSADTNFQIEGAVDPQTQIVYWQVTDDPDLVMSTGMYNLTQDVVSVQMNFPADIVQNWVLVRVDQQQT